MCIRDRSNTAWLYKINFIPQGLHNLPASFPVSYTHLDVYKRQVWIKWWACAAFAASITSSSVASKRPYRMFSMIDPLNSQVSVSYTHLDVYKRQEAARDLGAGNVTIFLKIILPLTVSGIISGIVMVFVPSLT